MFSIRYTESFRSARNPRKSSSNSLGLYVNGVLNRHHWSYKYASLHKKAAA